MGWVEEATLNSIVSTENTVCKSVLSGGRASVQDCCLRCAKILDKCTILELRINRTYWDNKALLRSLVPSKGAVIENYQNRLIVRRRQLNHATNVVGKILIDKVNRPEKRVFDQIEIAEGVKRDVLEGHVLESHYVNIRALVVIQMEEWGDDREVTVSDHDVAGLNVAFDAVEKSVELDKSNLVSLEQNLIDMGKGGIVSCDWTTIHEEDVIVIRVGLPKVLDCDAL